MSTVHNALDADLPRFEPNKDGSAPTFVTIIVAVCMIGYFANLLDVSTLTGISGELRAIGVFFPPLGVILGFM